MRLQFCGDLDCPDWLLAEIVALSKLSAVKVKLLASQITKDIINPGSLEASKITKQTGNTDSESNKALVAAVSFILTQAARYDASAERLDDELQQLGLPKEHANQLVKAYNDNVSNISNQLASQSLRLSMIVGPISWSLDHVVYTSHLDLCLPKPVVTLVIPVWSRETNLVRPIEMSLMFDKWRILIAEFRRILNMMKLLEPKSSGETEHNWKIATA